MIKTNRYQVYHGYIHLSDLVSLEDSIFQVEYEYLTKYAETGIAVLYDDSDLQPYKIRNQALSDVIADVRDLYKNHSVSTVFIRKLGAHGLSKRRFPIDNVGPIALIACGQFENSKIHIDDRTISFESGTMVILNSHLPVISIDPPIHGEMYLLSLHCIGNFQIRTHTGQ